MVTPTGDIRVLQCTQNEVTVAFQDEKLNAGFHSYVHKYGGELSNACFESICGKSYPYGTAFKHKSKKAMRGIMITVSAPTNTLAFTVITNRLRRYMELKAEYSTKFPMASPYE